MARQRLRDTLGKLRTSLPDPAAILVDTGLVGLDLNKAYIDQLDFQNLIDQAGRLPWQIPVHEPLPENTYKLLQKAISIWRSPRFLAGADLPSTPGLDSWLARTSQKLENLYVRVIERLSGHAQATGDLDQALELAFQGLSIDGLNEDLHALVMGIMIKAGRLGQAREHFLALQDLLRRELDIGPSPRIVDLYRQIRDSRPSGSPAGISFQWKVRPSLQAPFVGQKQALEVLHQALQKGGGALIVGESGQGKTRLLQEFTSKIEQPSRLLLSVCRPAERNLPFQPIIELFRQQVLPEEWLTLSPVWASQLALLIPELAIMRPDLEKPLFEADPQIAADQTRAILLEAIRQVFLHLCTNCHLLLCIDDAQWSDEATLAAIAYLLERSPFNQQALLLLAARKEESNPHLDALMTGSQLLGGDRVVHLQRLSLKEISELAQSVTHFSPSEHLVRRLAVETGGNPLYLLETLRAMLDTSGQPDRLERARLPLASSLKSLIHTRLGQVTPSTRRVLEAAAVLGTDFTPDTLTRVVRYPTNKMAEVLVELERRLLVEPISRDPQSIRYRFIHDKIREVLFEDIHPLQKRILHGRIALTLEDRLKSQAPDHAAVLAYHFENGGEVARAFDYWIQAGRRALQLYSSVDATQAFSRAEQLIQFLPDLSDEKINYLYSEWNQMAYMNEEPDMIRRINYEMLRIGRERDSKYLIGCALDGLSDACMAENRLEEGLSYTNQAIAYLEQSSDLNKHMEAYNHRGVFLYMLNQVEESIASFQDALALGATAQDANVLTARANAHYQIAFTRTLNGWPQIGLNHAQRSLADFSIVGRPHGQVMAYSALALAHYFLGDYPKARQDSQQGIEMARRIHAWRMLGYLYGYRAMIELAIGNLDSTLENAEQAIELGKRYHHYETVSGGYRILGDMYSWLNINDRAIEHYQAGLVASQDNFMAVDQMFRLGLSLSKVGLIDEGVELQQRAVEIAERTGLGIFLVMARLARVLILITKGQLDLAKTDGLSLQEETRKRSFPSVHLLVTNALGEIAMQESNLPAALGCFRFSAQEAAKMSQRWIEIESLLLLDKALRQSDKPVLASRQRLGLILDEIGMTATKEPIRRLFQDYRKAVVAGFNEQ
jgi:DNA-binding SARP family transcriptional activator